MTIITKNVEVTIALTPQEMAEMFWHNMNSEEQAKFFNHLAQIHEGRLNFQVEAIVNDEELTADGLGVLQMIGDYANT